MVVSCRFIAGASCHDLSLPFVSSFVFLNLFPLLLLYASTKGTLNPPQDEVNIKINRYINLALVLYGFSLYFLFLISLWNPTSLSGERNPSPINASDWRCVPLPCLGEYWHHHLLGTAPAQETSARPPEPSSFKCLAFPEYPIQLMLKCIRQNLIYSVKVLEASSQNGNQCISRVQVTKVYRKGSFLDSSGFFQQPWAGRPHS